MDKLRKVGLTALAGTFAIGSAQALEMSASGSAGFTYSSADDDEVQGERFSFGDSITLSGSGETDMGWTVTASYELDDGNTPYDDQTVFWIASALEKQRPWLDCAKRRPSLD